jgi:AAA+ ATPase superfamily predicted ATPase
VVAGAFVGRERELQSLRRRLTRVEADGQGTAVAIRGRRQVGKSRLVQEFCDRAGVPYLFFTATKGASPLDSTRGLLTALAESSLPADPETLPRQAELGWPDVWRVVASALPERPCVIVLDEVPWLAERDDLFDGALQTAWDRLLSRRSVLLLLLGSDLHMMERLTAYDRPFYGRADQLVLGPLNPAEVAVALSLPPADAIDAHLVSGGLPGVLRAWPAGLPALQFLAAECEDPASAVFTVAEVSLQAEFPLPDLSRQVLEAIGAGERPQANIASAAGTRHGALASGTLSPLLRRLVDDKRVLAEDAPLSTRPGRPARYRVADSNLRLYLAIRGAHELVRRGRPDAAFTLIERRWSSWRGKAVEPLVRQSLELAAAGGALPWPGIAAVGGWWNRAFSVEVDLVGADRSPLAQQILFAGSVKWLASPVDRHDVEQLRRAAPAVPGTQPRSTALVMACLSGRAPEVDPQAVDLWWGPRDVIAAW